MLKRKFIYWAFFVMIAGTGWGQARSSVIKPIPSDTIENFFRYSDFLYSGAQPNGEKAFKLLSDMGIKTIISVDGAKPDIENATKAGLRYIHVPIRYSGIPKDKGLTIAKAVREASRPVYVHCHHGKHRGPSAAALSMVLLGEWNPEKAIEAMKISKTGAKYTGLYQCVGESSKARESDFSQLPDEFPNVATVENMIESMVNIQHIYDHLLLCKEAGWKQPEGHPDIDPPHEALLLMEAFVELSRSDEVQKHDQAFKAMLSASERAAAGLESALQKVSDDEDLQRVNTYWNQIGKRCNACHSVYRNTVDVPQK